MTPAFSQARDTLGEVSLSWHPHPHPLPYSSNSSESYPSAFEHLARALASTASLRFASLNPPPARSFLAKYYDTRAGVASAVFQMLLRLLYQTLLVIPLVYLRFHCILVNADADFESVRVRLSYDHSGKAGDPSQKYFRKYSAFLDHLSDANIALDESV